MVSKGFDYNDMKEFLQRNGLPELSESMFVSGMTNRTMFNNQLYDPNVSANVNAIMGARVGPQIQHN